MILCPGVYVPTPNIGLPSIQHTGIMPPNAMPYRHPGSPYMPNVNSSHDLMMENDIQMQQNNANWEEGLQWLRDWMNRRDFGNMHDEPVSILFEIFCFNISIIIKY